MTRAAVKKDCVKCVKSSGVATCDGCQQSFCHRHLHEHRQELSQQMNSISQNYAHFREDLGRENDVQPAISHIDTWERESIAKIQSVAETARADLRQLIDHNQKNLNKSVGSVITEIQLSQGTNDYTEIDLKKWTEKLKELQRSFRNSLNISVVDDRTSSAPIRFIKVKNEPQGLDSDRTFVKFEQSFVVPQKPIPVVPERFHLAAGRVNLSEESLMATTLGYSSICGINLYFTKTHLIRFRILAKKNEGIFFGILTSLANMPVRATEQPSVYGWRDFDRVIINGNAELRTFKDKHIRSGDELTLTVNCDKRQIFLTHHRLNRQMQLRIDLKVCPLPWKLLVSSFGEDCVRILH